jgi:hypothetical protein
MFFYSDNQLIRFMEGLHSVTVGRPKLARAQGWHLSPGFLPVVTVTGSEAQGRKVQAWGLDELGNVVALGLDGRIRQYLTAGD